MTDAHTPRLLSDADAAADLAGVARPVSSEDAMANYTFTIVADSGYKSTSEGRCSAKQYGAVIYALHNDDSYAEQRDSLAAERDALAVRVRELEALAERLKLEAQIHAQEARTANATVAEIYQCVTGATGEPGNWNGAEPVRKRVRELEADARRYQWIRLADHVTVNKILHYASFELDEQIDAALTTPESKP